MYGHRMSNLIRPHSQRKEGGGLGKRAIRAESSQTTLLSTEAGAFWERRPKDFALWATLLKEGENSTFYLWAAFQQTVERNRGLGFHTDQSPATCAASHSCNLGQKMDSCKPQVSHHHNGTRRASHRVLVKLTWTNTYTMLSTLLGI